MLLQRCMHYCRILCMYLYKNRGYWLYFFRSKMSILIKKTYSFLSHRWCVFLIHPLTRKIKIFGKRILLRHKISRYVFRYAVIFLFFLRRILRFGGDRYSVDRMFVILNAFAFIIFFLWALFFHLDMTVRAYGTLTPSGENKIVQNLEGGIVSKIYIHPGEIVHTGQLLFYIDETSFSSQLRESFRSYILLLAQADRLLGEYHRRYPVFSPSLEKKPSYRWILQQEIDLYKEHRRQRRGALNVLRAKEMELQAELTSLKDTLPFLKRKLDLSEENLMIEKKLMSKGGGTKVDLIRAEKEYLDSGREYLIANNRKMSVIASIRSNREERQSTDAQAKVDVLNQLHATQKELLALVKNIAIFRDQVNRRHVRSPVDGVIKKIYLNTAGGVIGPGMALAEIVPIHSRVVMVAKVRPADIALVHEGMPVNVRITAYDYAIYGSFPAHVVRVGADAITESKDKKMDGAYFEVEMVLDSPKNSKVVLSPGMLGQADIIVGKRNVLGYIFKPVRKALSLALSEH